MNEIKKKIIDLVLEWVGGVTQDGEMYEIWYNEKDFTFSANGGCGGKEIRPDWIGHYVDKALEGLEAPIYVYRGKDDGIITIENRVVMEPDVFIDHMELSEAFEPSDIKGLFIGWD